ncbi:MAG TPA: CARDB domain-containing protein, partial [Pirellulales bacterium]|nr:CARDB domain-containing protein [Pirellulales bacterium]
MRRFGRPSHGKTRRGGLAGGAANERRSGYRTRRALIEVLEERAMLANQPDLAITAAAAPGTAVEGNAAKISITWTVKNQGAAPTSGPWNDAVYLSSSAAIDSGSLRIDTLDESFQGPLAAGASYTVTRVVTLPEATPGAQFLVMRTDDGQSLDDANLANNLYALPITLSAPAVDLAVTGATAPASAVAGDGKVIAVSWSVQNQGSVAADGTSTDAVYLSDTSTFDPQTATLLDSRNAGDQLPLAAGASYTVHRAITLADIPAGNHYLFFVANAYGGQGETDQGAETNNAYSLPIAIVSPGDVDLAVTGGAAPGAAVAGNGQAIDVSYTVENLGSTAAASRWTDGIYLSSQPTFDSSAISLGYYPGGARNALAGGGSYTVTQSLTLPSYPAGAAYLLVRTDRYADQSETNETNNLLAIPITLSAPDVDFTVSAATAPATAVVGDNHPITVDYTVANQGTDAAAGSWSDAIYVSDQSTFDSSAQRLETFYSGGGQLPASLAAGASYTVHESVALPDTAVGARYLLIRTNVGAGASSSQAETDAANNTYAIPITLSAPGADLEISDATAPATVEAGNGQTITVSWKVTNQGSAAAASSWYDDVLVGDDANYDPGNTSLLGYYGNYQNQLAAGASYVVTQTVAAPNVSPGARQLVFVTDTGDEQAETQKSN